MPPSRPPAAPHGRAPLAWGLAAALALAACPSQAAKVPLIKLTPAQEQALRIVLSPVGRADAAPVARVPATFMPPPNGRVAVTAAFPGVVTRLLVVEGQPVRRGQPLASVFSRDALNAAAELGQARAEAQVAAQAQRRTAQLVREGIVAGARGEEADARLRSAAAVTSAKSLALRTAGADASGRYTLRAPIAGRVAHVGPQAGEALETGAVAFLVDRTDRIQAQATLAAALAGKVHVGDRAVVEGAEGRVVSVGSAIDAKTRSISLLAEVPPRHGFIPGRATSIAIYAGAAPGLLSAPRGAIVRLNARPVVFLRRPDGYVPTPVRLQGFADDRAVFAADLPPDAKVAATGVSELKALAEK